MVIIRNVTRPAKKMEYVIPAQKMEKENKKIGFAVDIGTTTVAMTGISFCKGEVLGEIARRNEQTKLGADVMMRIMHATSGKAKELQQMIVTQIENMALEILSQKEKIDEYQIVFTVVGNTTMSHLFLGKEVQGLAGAPFESSYRGNYSCLGEEIGMTIFPKARVQVLSSIKAHVGGDALAVIGALSMYKTKKKQLAIDLGTNAEIILNDRGALTVCSTAAGPALEGKGVFCGMPAKKGAVCSVKIAPGNGNIILEVIDDLIPRGICGTGLVDLLAQLKKCHLMTDDGYLYSAKEARQEHLPTELIERLVIRKEERAFLLYAPENDEKQKEVYLLQSDIRNLQLAKSAIQAGVCSLLSRYKLKLPDIEEVIVTGVLGSYMNVANAMEIGLFPDVEKGKLHFVKNAAGEGAVRMLFEEDFADNMEEIVQKMNHIELAEEADFQKTLFDSMHFQRWS